MSSIRIRGASEHNLKGVSLDVPRQRLSVFTGVSGSGKSSLAFDTIYREGRRRFLESLSAYARRFLGGGERPDVERIDGLSPAVAIEQKTISGSPRSTVGTITEIHDHLRLLFARLGQPHCTECKRPIRSQSAEQVVDQLMHRFAHRRVLICAPVLRERKGGHRQVLDRLRRDGFLRVRIDGEVVRLRDEELKIDRNRAHTIEVVYDRQAVRAEARSRLVEAVERCFALSDGVVNIVVDEERVEGASRPNEETEHTFSGRFACPDCGIDLPELEPRLFSFNTPQGACATCKGLGLTSQVDPELLVEDPSLPFRRGGIFLFDATGQWLYPELDVNAFRALAKRYGFHGGSSWGDLDETARRALLEGDEEFVGLLPRIDALRRETPDYLATRTRDLPCPDCDGARLSPLARAVQFEGWSLPGFSALALREASEVLAGIRLEGSAERVGRPILEEIRWRLSFLERLGLSYLTLARGASSLSAGEAQRIRLASHLGADLQGVIAVLDEPSIGLHWRDHRRLVETLCELRDRGNTVLVVEHDEDTIRAADHLVDLGPGAGVRGGEIVVEGDCSRVEREEKSVTGAYLSGRRTIHRPPTSRPPGKAWLELFDVRHNNLKGIDVRVPLGNFVAVTGVSGSGKSSLVNQVLKRALLWKRGQRGAQPGRHRSLRGAHFIDKLVDIDQSPVGKSPRSNPATYTKVFSRIRDLFASLPDARARGYSAGRFSFNVEGGRCADCGGAGVTTIDMQFLAPVEIVCDACGGRRYTRETLEILYRGRNISEVLDMTVEEALEFFRNQPRIVRTLETMAKIGLGYLTLGQPINSLSGGESQRIKLVSELQKRDTGKTLYVLDEPTTGLHSADVDLLLEALHELVDRGNSIIVIEHHLDVIRSADHVIDLGPEGGDQGGEIVVAGTVADVLACEASHTGRALRVAAAREGGRPAVDGAQSPTGGGAHGEAVPGGGWPPGSRPTPAPHPGEGGPIVVEGATLHNLQSVNVAIPRESISVITGVSGSGKTSLAFDTIFAEGQRRYIESLSTYARHFLGRLQAPPVRSVQGLAPAIAIDQKSVLRSQRSTVATATEIHEYLRLLFARIGRPHCPECSASLTWTSPSRLAEELIEAASGERLHVLAPTAISRGEAEEVRDDLARLLKAGFTRVLVGGREVRLDEDDPSLALRIVLDALRKLPESGAPGDDFFVVVDRLVLAGKVQSRLADSLDQAFRQGDGLAVTMSGAAEPRFHTRIPSCPRGHFRFAGNLTPRMFSFNSVEGACPRCGGVGREKRARESLVFRHEDRPVLEAMDRQLLRFLEKYRTSSLKLLRAAIEHLGISPDRAYRDLTDEQRALLLHGHGGERIVVRLERGSFETGWLGLLTLLDRWWRDEGGLGRFGLERFFEERDCAECGGHRLRREMLHVRVGGLGIHEITELTIVQAREFFEGLDLDRRDQRIAREVLIEVSSRLRFLDEVGLGYLALNRSASTLSGGEAQRIRLASQLGSRLAGVIYVLDEPTVGLHARDTLRLLQSLRELRDLGNTVILVEHDRETIQAADHVIDLGPGAGERGGRVVASGSPAEVRSCGESLTGRYLRGEERSVTRRPNRREATGALRLQDVRCHNLDGIDVEFPIGTLVAVTGVSGSGKSTLVMDVLARAVKDLLQQREVPAGLVGRVEGLEAIRRLVVVDQRAIGRTPQSTPATYTKLWGPVRELYARLPLARVRGYGADRFSFNSPEGRCSACDGQGQRLVDMQFLSDVWIRCDECGGRRFEPSTLEVLFRGRSIADVLDLEVDQAAELFDNQPRILRILTALQHVGLGYVRLGQSSATLSGGEAQRVKLARELAEPAGGGNLYILDEPTTGLHFEDVKRLVAIFHRLVDAENTLVVIEHQLDVIAAADHVIELGPGAGDEGGRIVAEGPPEEVARRDECPTAPFLRGVL